MRSIKDQTEMTGHNLGPFARNTLSTLLKVVKPAVILPIGGDWEAVQQFCTDSLGSDPRAKKDKTKIMDLSATFVGSRHVLRTRQAHYATTRAKYKDPFFYAGMMA